MARRKRTQTPKPLADDGTPSATWESQVFTGGANLHDLFTQQARDMLDRTDLDERAKQAILVAMNCACCGAGGMNYTAKIARKAK